MTDQGAAKVSLFRNAGLSGGLNATSFEAKDDFTTGTTPYGVAIADLDGDGKCEVIVVNQGSTNFSVLHNTSTSGVIDGSTLAGSVDFTASGQPRGIAIADFDGDARLDIVLGNNSNTSVQVFRNTSIEGKIDSNSFESGVNFTVGTNPRWVAVADIDGDKKPEIVVANQGSNTISVLRNVASAGVIDASSFETHDEFSTGAGPACPVLGDYNGDGKIDVATVNATDNNVSVLRNTAVSGTINGSSFASDLTFSTGTSPSRIAAGDINGDAKLDLVVSNNSSLSVSVLRNTGSSGSISFATNVDFTVANNPVGVAVGDLTGDGKPEIVATNSGVTSISILHNIADPPTITSITPASGKVGTAVTITGTSFDATAANNTVFFDPIKATVTSASTTSLTVTVPNGAVYGPIAVTAGNRTAISTQFFIPTFSGDSPTFDTSSLAPKEIFTTETTSFHVAVGDLDGDGKPDLAVTNNTTNSVSVLRNTSSAGTINGSSFATQVPFTTGADPIGVAIGDLDGDGKPDIATANNSANTVGVFRNTSTSGTISFAAEVPFTGAGSLIDVAIGDLDGDGKPDLAATSSSTDKVSVFRNTAVSGAITTDSFSPREDFDTGTTPKLLAIGDIDGDGKPDLIVSDSGALDRVSVLRNTATPGLIDAPSSFAATADFVTGADPNGVAIGDLDGDGKLDIAITNQTDNTVSIFRNTSVSGSISLAAKIDSSTGTTPIGVAIGDMDGDGRPDVVVSNDGGSVSIFRNTSTSGSISLAGEVNVSLAATARDVAVADLDGDGIPDLAIPNISTTVSVLHNLTSGAALARFNGASVFDASPTLDWADVTGTASYTLEYADNSGFSGSTTVTGITASQLTPDLGDGTFFWRVKSISSGATYRFTTTDNFVVNTLQVDPQGVRIRLSILLEGEPSLAKLALAVSSDSGMVATIGDTVQVDVISIPELDTLIVGLSSDEILGSFGDIGLVDTLLSPTGDGITDTFTVKFAVSPGDAETTDSGVIAQAKLSVVDDTAALKLLHNLIDAPMVRIDPGLGLVGDGVRVGVDGQRPVNTGLVDSVVLDTTGLGTVGGLRAIKKGDVVTLGLDLDYTKLLPSNASQAVVVVLDTSVDVNTESALDSAIHTSTIPDLFDFEAQPRESFTVTEGQFRNNQRVRAVAYLVDDVGNLGASQAGSANPEGIVNDVVFSADAVFPVITAENPNPDSGVVRFTGQDTAVLDIVNDEGVFRDDTTFSLNPLKLSVDEATRSLLATSGGDTVDFGGQVSGTFSFATKTATDSLGANTEQGGKTLDVTIVAEDSVGNRTTLTLENVIQDAVKPEPERLFPKSGELPGGDERTINEETRHPILALTEDIDSLSVRFIQVDASPPQMITESLTGVTSGEGDVRVTVGDSLMDGQEYVFQVFLRDLAGNIFITEKDTLAFSRSFENPTADAFVVTLDSTSIGVDSVIAGVGLPLRITAVDTKTVGELLTVVTYEESGGVLRVDAGEQDTSSVRFSGSGVTDNGDGTGTLNGGSWAIGSRVVSVRSTKRLDEFAVEVQDSTGGESITGRLASLTVDAAEFTTYSLKVFEEGVETAGVSGVFEIDLTPADAYGNPSTKVFDRAVDLNSSDSLTASTNLLESRVPDGNVMESIWAEFAANIGDVRLPPGPQEIKPGRNRFTAVAPDREGEGLVITARSVNAPTDTSGITKSQLKAVGSTVSLTFVPHGTAPVGPELLAGVDTLIVQDYLGPKGEGDQGRLVLFVFPRSEDHARLSQYRVYREIQVTTDLDDAGELVTLEEPVTRFVPWAVIDPVPQKDGEEGPVYAVVPALDNKESRWAITGEYGRKSSEPRVLAKRVFTKARIQQMAAVLGLDPNGLISQGELEKIFDRPDDYVKSVVGERRDLLFARLDPDLSRPRATVRFPRFIRAQTGRIRTTEQTISEPERAVDNLPPAQVPVASMNGTVTNDGTTLNWTPSEDDRVVGFVPYRGFAFPIPGVEGYEIWRGEDANGLEKVATLPAGSRAFTDTVSGPFLYRIDAFDLDNVTEGTAAPLIREYADANGDPVYLLALGDFRQDFNDFVIFALAFDSSLGDPNYNGLADIDQDGTVGFFDFLPFSLAFNRVATTLNGQPIASTKRAAETRVPGIGYWVP